METQLRRCNNPDEAEKAILWAMGPSMLQAVVHKITTRDLVDAAFSRKINELDQQEKRIIEMLMKIQSETEYAPEKMDDYDRRAYR